MRTIRFEVKMTVADDKLAEVIESIAEFTDKLIANTEGFSSGVDLAKRRAERQPRVKVNPAFIKKAQIARLSPKERSAFDALKQQACDHEWDGNLCKRCGTNRTDLGE